MPKPIYMLCSESGSEDRTTNLISHFNVLEQIELRTVPESNPGQPIVVFAHTFQVVSVWLREDEDDPEQPFECEVIFRLPEGEEIVAAATKFTFEKPRYRVTVRASGHIFKDAGLCVAESRVRKFGDQPGEWVTQSYPLMVITIPSDPAVRTN